MQNGKRNIFRIFCLLLALTLLGVELSVLLKVRKLLPGGIAPVVLTSGPVEVITGHDDRDWIMYDARTLDFFRDAIRTDIEGIEEIAPGQLPRIIRDWSRKQALNLGIGLETQDPCRILDSLDDGEEASCMPLAVLFTAAANSMGLKARRVDLFGYPGGFDHAHSTVEIREGEKWVIEDPTFNSVAIGPDGEKLGACEVQRLYEEGGEVEWVQDVTATEPDFDNYFMPPESLFKVVVYQLHLYPVQNSPLELRLQRFRERITGQIQSVVLTKEKFPVSDIVLSGGIDRLLLAAVVILLVLAAIPARRRKG